MIFINILDKIRESAIRSRAFLTGEPGFVFQAGAAWNRNSAFLRSTAETRINILPVQRIITVARVMHENLEKMLQQVRLASGKPGSHGLDHVQRVVSLCSVIGREENADMGVLLPAAIFHDIARPEEEEKGMPHEEVGARMAELFLRSIRYDVERIPKITHAIRTHRYLSTEKPETLEARILSDADKLDAMGAVGIARTFLRAGEHRGDITGAVKHMQGKLLSLRGLMYTETAKRIAEDRHRVIMDYLEILKKEITLPGPPDIRL